MDKFIDMELNINKRDMGIYIHIPFCVRKCVYCDFLSAPAEEATKKAYMQALIREIEYVAHNMENIGDRLVKTVFFGGGTPTVADTEDIENVLVAIRKNFPVDENIEITIECNPGTLDKNKAERYRKAGINRISFGLQSAHDDVLAMLGRIHTFEQFDESMKIARTAGFDNINVDVMSALPGQSLEEYMDSLRRILVYEPEHISAYSLIVEEGTVLYEKLSEFPPLPDEDTERKMYYETDALLKEYGYDRYEISNYAKEGKECRHNISYWERTDYLGFGIGAASLFNGKRRSNITNLSEYIAKAGVGYMYEDIETLTKKDAMEEFMFLGLRKISGVNFQTFREEFGSDILCIYGEQIAKNINTGLLEYVYDTPCTEYVVTTVPKPIGVRLTKRGIDISNVVLSEFLL